LGGVQGLPELGVLAHAVAVAADRDEMALMHEAIDERGGHDLVAEDAEMRTVPLCACIFQDGMYNTHMNDIARGEPGGLFTLLHTAGVASNHVETKLATVGLSLAKLAALKALKGAGESLPLSQLAERLSCVKSNITQLVDRLEADGLVTRADDPRDRRSRLAVMTAAGRKACDAGLSLQEEAERALLSDLSAAERQQLAVLMGKLEKGAR